MRHLLKSTIAALAACMTLAACSEKAPDSNKLVILHTNDTHSQIDPGSDGLGGVMRRKAVIDSIRKVEPNVLLVDAGDAVQGTLYFYLYGGKVEQDVMNILGVDTRILGNHEFDNGIDSLAAVLKLSDAQKLSTNYKLDGTPLAGMFEPYTIKEYGGKRIGIIGINLDPTGIITKGNYDGLEYLPIVATANLTAEKLKKEEGVDAVIAISHIGYNPAGLIGDSILATNSRDIDIIIGGHSHDTIDPVTPQGAARSRLKNLDGDEVLVVQTGKAGRRLGKIEINLDSIGLGAKPKYELITIDNRFDNYNDPELAGTIAKYSAGVDSLMHLWVGECPRGFEARSTEQLNYFTDFIRKAGETLAPGIDFAIANKGGLRDGIPAGKFSKGHVINMIPFANYVTVVDLKGSDLLDIFNVMAMTDGNGISDNVRAAYVKDGDKAHATKVLIDGKPVDPDRTYRVATIDYLAKGGDYMSAFTRGKVVAQSTRPLYDLLLDELAADGAPVEGSSENRWTLEK